MKKIVIATIKPWNIDNALKFKEKYINKYEIYIFSKKEDLNSENLKQINPDYIFFPHWSWIIPKTVFNNFESIVFHMTDLPYGRGGSPLQNLILNKRYDTKISAIQVEKGLDTGKIYIKRDFFVGKGSAQEIFKKLSDIVIFDMIPYIIENDIIPYTQNGESVNFKRRAPEESDLAISSIKDLNDFYDFVRMLDAQTYPKAFLKFKNFKIFFKNISFEDKKLVGRFEIEEK